MGKRPDNKNPETRVSFRVSKNEISSVKLEAKRLGLSISDYCRSRIFDNNSPVQDRIEVLGIKEKISYIIVALEIVGTYQRETAKALMAMIAAMTPSEKDSSHSISQQQKTDILKKAGEKADSFFDTALSKVFKYRTGSDNSIDPLMMNKFYEMYGDFMLGDENK